MEPLITIITVSYNCIDTIERTIKSVLAQDYSNYRYIVVDGNSTDGTYDAINKYNESLYRFISEPDEGMYYAMNKGISFVNDGFILFLNGDDYFVDNNVLTRMSHYLTNDTTVVIGRISSPSASLSTLTPLQYLPLPYAASLQHTLYLLL